MLWSTRIVIYTRVVAISTLVLGFVGLEGFWLVAHGKFFIILIPTSFLFCLSYS